jgi:hypothetical protein
MKRISQATFDRAQMGIRAAQPNLGVGFGLMTPYPRVRQSR